MQLLSGGNMLLGSILPAMSSMLSEEGAFCPHRNSLLELTRKNEQNQNQIQTNKNKPNKNELWWLGSAG